MKHALLAVCAAILMAGSSGCTHGVLASKKGCGPGCEGNCNLCGVATDKGVNHFGDRCNGGGVGVAGHHREYKHSRKFFGPHGPPAAQVTYPYYTTRGPRDFLLNAPPTIGP